MTEPTAFPLSWPVGWRRMPPGRRVDGKFAFREYQGPLKNITIAQACDRLLKELERMAIRPGSVIISTNVQPTLTGRPRSGERLPDDPGAAVYWVDQHTSMGKQSRCMAIDRYTRVEQNIAALAATIEAMRAIERHGGAMVLDRAFMGFTALPAPIVAGMKRPWREVFGLGPGTSINTGDVQRAYRRLATEHHPDRAQDADRAEYTRRMAEINAARDDALKELG